MPEFYRDPMPKRIKGSTTAHVKWPVGPYVVGRVQVLEQSGAANWSNAVITFRRSNDGVEFHDLDAPLTISADGITEPIDLSGFGWLGAFVTTTDASAPELECWACFQGDVELSPDSGITKKLHWTAAGAVVEWDVGSYVSGTVQVHPEMPGSTWSTAVVEIQYSIDGVHFESFAPAHTLNDDGMTDPLDLIGVAKIRAVATTRNTVLNVRDAHCIGMFKR